MSGYIDYPIPTINTVVCMIDNCEVESFVMKQMHTHSLIPSKIAAFGLRVYVSDSNFDIFGLQEYVCTLTLFVNNHHTLIGSSFLRPTSILLCQRSQHCYQEHFYPKHYLSYRTCP